MAEVKEHIAALGGAAVALRETAKWLAGGIFATAAGVFAGSSLTSFGSLDPAQDTTRFILAVAGLVIGSTGLVIIFSGVVRVLTAERVTLRDLADGAAGQGTPHIQSVGKEVEDKYRKDFPPDISSLREVVAATDNLDPATPEWKEAEAFVDIMVGDAAFISVRQKFESMLRILPFGAAAALVGFLVFAWAANPDREAEKADAGTGADIVVSVDMRSAVGQHPPCRHRCRHARPATTAPR